ncbi:DUF3577 domain-containing protein, partial [Pseudomonas aeruginosa]|uniref:DUF3577 domain-containing protein n=1 Tax=Pseudomonas aeruginosa TaxID=287 RepID=UPI0034E0A5CB
DDSKQRPLVRFRLGDLWGDAYIRDKGEQKGQAAAAISVTRLGAQTSIPSREEVERALAGEA